MKKGQQPSARGFVAKENINPASPQRRPMETFVRGRRPYRQESADTTAASHPTMDRQRKTTLKKMMNDDEKERKVRDMVRETCKDEKEGWFERLAQGISSKVSDDESSDVGSTFSGDSRRPSTISSPTNSPYTASFSKPLQATVEEATDSEEGRKRLAKAQRSRRKDSVLSSVFSDSESASSSGSESDSESESDSDLDSDQSVKGSAGRNYPRRDKNAKRTPYPPASDSIPSPRQSVRFSNRGPAVNKGPAAGNGPTVDKVPTVNKNPAINKVPTVSRGPEINKAPAVSKGPAVQRSREPQFPPTLLSDKRGKGTEGLAQAREMGEKNPQYRKQRPDDMIGDVVPAPKVDVKWGKLFLEESQPTQRLKDVVLGIANHIDAEYSPVNSRIFTPRKLHTFYTKYGLESECLPLQRLFDPQSERDLQALGNLYKRFACEYHLVPLRSGSPPTIPSLTPYGFQQWATLLIQAFPNQEHERTSRLVQNVPLQVPETGGRGGVERLPRLLYRSQFPSKEYSPAVKFLADGLQEWKRAVGWKDPRPSVGRRASVGSVPRITGTSLVGMTLPTSHSNQGSPRSSGSSLRQDEGDRLPASQNHRPLHRSLTENDYQRQDSKTAPRYIPDRVEVRQSRPPSYHRDESSKSSTRHNSDKKDVRQSRATSSRRDERQDRSEVRQRRGSRTEYHSPTRRFSLNSFVFPPAHHRPAPPPSRSASFSTSGYLVRGSRGSSSRKEDDREYRASKSQASSNPSRRSSDGGSAGPQIGERDKGSSRKPSEDRRGRSSRESGGPVPDMGGGRKASERVQSNTRKRRT